RTDAGVHALRNVFQVDIRRRTGEFQAQNVPPSTVQNALNFHLESTSLMHIRDVSAQKQAFDARRSAVARTYTYRLLVPRKKGLYVERESIFGMFQSDRAWQVDRPLNIPAMRAAAQELLGEQDFSSLRNGGCQSKSPVRRVLGVDVASTADYPRGIGGGGGGGGISNGSSGGGVGDGGGSGGKAVSSPDDVYSSIDQEPAFLADLRAGGYRDVGFDLLVREPGNWEHGNEKGKLEMHNV
ncbi:pseudouridine synthase, partial [Ochromonadaceae sp. CCMP2298]